MITRRTRAISSRSPSPPSLVILCLLPAFLCLLLLSSPAGAFEVLHTAAAVNDTASSAAADSASATAAVTHAERVVPEFVPTSEWQTIQPGQAIPPGLWVRMDMTTGEKTARLLPEEGEEQLADGQGEQLESAGLVIVPKAEDEAQDGAVYEDDGSEGREVDASESYSARDGDEAEIPVTVLSAQQETTAGTLGAAALDLPPSSFANPTPAQLAAIKAARAARLREIAEAFKPTDDLAIIKQLLSIIMKGGAATGDGEEAVGLEGCLQAMELLESLVHQVDNAADFVGLGGLDMILQMLDASTLQRSLPSSLMTNQQHKDDQAGQQVSEREQALRLAALQEKAAWLLGTAAQNNPTVKKEAMKEQTIHVMLQLIDHTLSEVQTASASADVELREAWMRVQGKALYALSSLLRSFPTAQEEFHQRRGSDRLLALLTSTAPSDSVIDKQQLTVFSKTATLLSDLLQDRLINNINASSSVLFDQLTDDQWCAVFANITMHTAPLLTQAGSPAAALPSTLSALKTADVVLGIIKLLAEHRLCATTLASSPALRGHVEQQSAEVDERMGALGPEDESQRYHYTSMQQKLQAMKALLSPVLSHSSASSATSQNNTGRLVSGLSLLGVPLTPCSSAPLTGWRRDSYCRHDPNDGGRHLICAMLTDSFLTYSRQQGNDLVTPRPASPVCAVATSGACASTAGKRRCR